MFVRLHPGSSVPIYRQILDQIRYQVANRTLRPGDRMPSVRDLARRLATNQNTILKVYDQLAAEGLVQRRQGDGTFVAEAAPALKRSECKKRLRDTLSQAAVQVHLFRIPADEARTLLDAEIKAIEQGPGTGKGGRST